MSSANPSPTVEQWFEEFQPCLLSYLTHGLNVEAEAEEWRRSRAERDAVPALVSLRDSFEAIRDEILAADPDADASEATRRLVNRLLHRPSEALRDMAAAGGEDPARMLERLFGLDGRNNDEDTEQ